MSTDAKPNEDIRGQMDADADCMAYFFFALVRRQFTRQEALELVKMSFTPQPAAGWASELADAIMEDAKRNGRN